MPLSCLSDLSDPALFDEAIGLATQWGAEIGERYVISITKNCGMRGGRTGLYPIRKPRGYWRNYVFQHLQDGRSLVFSDLSKELSGSELGGLNEALRNLYKKGVIARSGSYRNYRYSLK